MRTSSLVAGLLLVVSFSLAKGQDLPESKHYRLEKLADGIFAAIHNNDGGYAICNAGIIDLGDKTVVVDPFFSPAAARDLKKHAEIHISQVNFRTTIKHCKEPVRSSVTILIIMDYIAYKGTFIIQSCTL